MPDRPQLRLHSQAMIVCPTCGTESPDSSRFCPSCGSSLVPACPVCGAERPPGARFCPSCGAALVEEAPIPAGQERRLVTILFADVTGSTGLGERLDPERLQEVLGTYFAAMREEIEAEGGTVEKFIGDAVMAAFGVPAAHEDDPARALRAALRMRRRLEQVNRDLDGRIGVTLRIRIGVNTGEVLAAVRPRPGEPMVTGDAVNVAARLEQQADPDQVVVAERTARAVRGFRFRELGERELRGKEQPVPAVSLEEQVPGAPQRGVPGLSAPMVGRDAELDLLASLYRRSVAERRPNLVTIYGDPGVGKSRLTVEFVSWAESQDPAPQVVRGRCLPYVDGATYWPLAEILKGLAGIHDSDPPEVALGRLRALGRDLISHEVASNPGKATAALGYSVGVEDPEFGLRNAEPREVRLKIHAAWRSLVSALAAGSPVVVVIEDIHWADQALLDLLEELADRVIGPVLFVCPSRPELTERRPGWGGGRRNVSTISLDPLTPDESDRLVRFLLAVEDLPVAVHDQILQRAEGNPFFLEEIVRHLIDEGRIVREGARWRARSQIHDVRIPDTVQAVLAARIDLLDPTEKRALQRAAVVGRVFWPGPVGRLLESDRGRLDETFMHLVERELVLSRLSSSIAGEPEFIFKHVLTREVAYESLPRRDRSGAHAAVASWIEETAGARRGEFAELLAYHYEEAYRSGNGDRGSESGSDEGLRRKAFESLMEASDVARRRFALAKAAAMAERAQALSREPSERAAALEQVGMVAFNDYRGDLAFASFQTAVDLRANRTPEDKVAIARVCARAVEIPMRWPGSMKRMPSEAAVRRLLDLGIANAPEGDSEELVRLLLAAGFIAYAFGHRRQIGQEEYARAESDAERATEMALRLGRPDLASAALDSAGSTLMPRGLYGRSRTFVERRLRLAETMEDPWELGDINAVAAWTSAMIGDYPEAIRMAERGEAAALGHHQGMALHNLSWRAFAEFSLGDWATVIDDTLPRVFALLGDRRADPPYFTAHAFGSATLVHDARGDAAAEELIGLLRRHAASTQGEWPRLSLIWLAWIVSRQGRTQEVDDLLAKLDFSASGIARPLEDQVRAEIIARHERWDEAPVFLERSRAFSEQAELRALPVHLDRLEGRAAVAAGDLDRGLDLLRRARGGFDRIGAAWERARTDLDVADARVSVGRFDEARTITVAASPDLERAGALLELERLRSLLGG